MWVKIINTLDTVRLWVGATAVNIYSHPRFWCWVGNVLKVTLFGFIVYIVYSAFESFLILALEIYVLFWLLESIVVAMGKFVGNKKAKFVFGPWLAKVIGKAIVRYILWTFTWRQNCRAEEAPDETIELY